MTKTAAWRVEARALSRLAWPVMLSSLNWTLLHITDIAVVGQAGTAEVAAFAASRTLTYITIVAGISAQAGILVYAARADGAGDRAATGEVFREGVLLGAVFGLVAAVILFLFAAPILTAIGIPPAIVPRAALVVQAAAVGYPATFLLTAAAYWLEGISRPRAVMTVNLVMLPLNALLAWALSGGHLGLPALGAVGAALATAIAVWIGAVLMLAAAWRADRDGSRGVRTFARAAWFRALRGVPTLATFGAVPALAAALELGGFAWLIVLSTQLGDSAAHAFQIVFSLHNLTFALAMGFGSAAGVRVGNAVGAGEWHLVRERAGIAAAIAGGLTIVAALALIVFDVWLTAAFPATPEVHALAAAMLLLWAAFIPFDGIQVVFTYALRSLGDQVAAGAVSVFAFFILTGGLGWWLTRGGYGTAGLVIAAGAGMLAAALLMGARFVSITARSRSSNSVPSHPSEH